MDIIAGFLHKRVIEMTGLELLEVFSMALNRDVAQSERVAEDLKCLHIYNINVKKTKTKQQQKLFH